MSAIDTEEIARLEAAHPSAFGAGPLARAVRTGALILGFGYMIYLARELGLLSWLFVSGLDDTGTIVRQMWPPAPNSWESFIIILWKLGETVAMALLGTLFAALIAVPLGFIGAKTVVKNEALHFTIRRGFDFFRGMPALIWALVFVRAVGLGPMTGVLAFIMADFPALSKLYAEAIETADKKPIEGVMSAGADGTFVLRFGLLPQVMPVMLSLALYFFESNVRSATILGIVGAGGIGLVLAEAIRFQLWPEVAFIILLILVIVALIDAGSRWLREKLIGRTETG